jgi:hypothetical protein
MGDFSPSASVSMLQALRVFELRRINARPKAAQP